MHPFLVLWLAGIVFSVLTKRWLVVASLTWVAASMFDFVLVALVLRRNLTDEQLPNVDLFLVLGMLAVTVTLALLWVRSRRGARVVWWLCAVFTGAWLCLGLWRWTTLRHAHGYALLVPAAAVVMHLLAAFAISRMWPRTAEPEYGQAFE